MSEQDPEFNTARETAESQTIDLTEEGSVIGSGQTIGIEPGDNFIAPTMALDSLEQESDD